MIYSCNSLHVNVAYYKHHNNFLPRIDAFIFTITIAISNTTHDWITV